MTKTLGQNTGHGHVWERPDGVKARCGGPGICAECRRDAAFAARLETSADPEGEISALKDLRLKIAAGATDADVKVYEYEDRNGMAWRIRTRVEARYAFADAMLAAR